MRKRAAPVLWVHTQLAEPLVPCRVSCPTSAPRPRKCPDIAAPLADTIMKAPKRDNIYQFKHHSQSSGLSPSLQSDPPGMLLANKAQCTVLNCRRFMEKFLEENKGQGPHVDALSQSSPYVPVPPDKMDFIEFASNPRQPSDPDFDQADTDIERLYRYVMIDPSDKTQSFAWTRDGQRDLLKDRAAFEARERTFTDSRDRTLSRLLNQLSPESRTLLNNTPGFATALATNDLWTIFRVHLPASHDQVSTSAVQKRTRTFLSSSQSVPLPAFIEAFVRDADQFTSDWESAIHPGHIKIDALIRNTFVEAIRNGVDSALLQPAIEALSLSPTPHRDASFKTAQTSLSSYYIRNKPEASVEETAILKAATSSHVKAPACMVCNNRPRLSVSELTSVISSMARPRPVKGYLGPDGGPQYCQSCVLHPPACACGSPMAAPFHKLCRGCFQKQRSSKKPTDSGKSGRPQANVASSEQTQSTQQSSPLPSQSQYQPPWSMPHPGYYHPTMWPPYPGLQYPPYSEDDHLSDYHSTTGSTTHPPNKANIGALLADQSTWLTIEASLRSTPVSGACLSAAHTTPPGGTSPFYVDTGASMHCTAFKSDLAPCRSLLPGFDHWYW